MSATTTPISAAAFALAIADLPLSNLHFKAAEIRNSIAHLDYSNEQLQPFADEGDSDCADAIRENETVIARMQERIALLRREVEGRGMRWADAETEGKEQINGSGAVDTEMVDAEGGVTNGVHGGADVTDTAALAGGTTTEPGRPAASGRLTDEELARRLRRRMGDPDGEEDEGLHL
ncbi:hypothetical protein B0A49_09498 [Cryomyces minteri]|uniref:Uncharacterized protein n=1 Tax=Cryomyces minteri TaxID=331657 RepID=A0A4U0W3S2_9PEZI|nr:hypothetical protein B0A49_09498 [Cryomyces minteri]